MCKYAGNAFVSIAVTILLCCIIVVQSSSIKPLAPKTPEVKRFEGGLSGMGMDVSVQLFNLKVYNEKILPAYQALLEKDDPKLLVELLKNLAQEGDSKEFYNEAIGILDGTVHYAPDDYSFNLGIRETPRGAKQIFVEDNLSSRLLLAYCVPYDKGVNPKQDMSRSLLVDYLYKKSKWMKSLFTFSSTVHGASLQLTMGESSEFFTKEDLIKFKTELNKLPIPKDLQTRTEFENLHSLVKLALTDPNLALVLSVG
jgi:hypothetical protein